MNVTARGMICGRSCAPCSFHAAVPSSTRRNTPDSLLAWNVLNVSGRPDSIDSAASRSSSGISSVSAPGVIVPSAMAWSTP